MNNYNNTVVGDHLLISHYIKYDRLTELINKEFYNSGYDKVNLFIDAYSMIKSVYGLKPSQFTDKFSMASCIINACAHYRQFFWSRYKVTTKIWIVYSNMYQSILEANTFCSGYGNIMTSENNPEMDSYIMSNMNVLDIICPYLPDIQYIITGFEPGLIFGQIAKNYPDIPNIIVSKDPWNLQVVGNMPNVYMLRPIKRNGEDLSVLISAMNVLEYYVSLRKVDYPQDKLRPSEIHPSFISFIMAVTKFPERNMKSIHNLSSILKYLNTTIDKLHVMNQPIYDIKGLCESIIKANKVNLKSYEIGLRYNAMAFNPCLFRYFTSTYKTNSEINNLHDPNSLKRLNETYFSKVPLDLMSL